MLQFFRLSLLALRLSLDLVRFVLWWHPFPASTDRSSRDRLGAFMPYSDRNTLATVLHNYLAHLRDLTCGLLMT
jgi:hypothetical protein